MGWRWEQAGKPLEVVGPVAIAVVTGLVIERLAGIPLWLFLPLVLVGLIAAVLSVPRITGGPPVPVGIGHPVPGPLKLRPGQILVGEVPAQPPSFVNRIMLDELREFFRNQAGGRVCVLIGPRGVGKTQIAAAFARERYDEGCPVVAWVSGESAEQLWAGLAELADRLGTADPGGDSQLSARRLLQHLRECDEALLVVDNAVDSDEVRSVLLSTGRCEVVVISTDRRFVEFRDCKVVDVLVFTRQESIAYLEERIKLADPAKPADLDGAHNVAHELGDLPLAVAQAAAIIRAQRLGYDQYLEKLRRLDLDEVLLCIAGGYPRSTAQALTLSVTNAEESDPSCLAGLLLLIIAILAPEGVTRDLLYRIATGMNPHATPDQVDHQLGTLVSMSMLSWTRPDDSVVIHRLTARVIHERSLHDPARQSNLGDIITTLEQLLPGEEIAETAARDFAKLFPHVAALWDNLKSAHQHQKLPIEQQATDRTKDWFQIVAAGARLMNRVVGQLIAAAADLPRSIAIADRLHSDCVRVLGPTHPHTLDSRNILVRFYQEAEQPDQIIILFETSLADRQCVLGSGHPDTLASSDALADAYESAGRFDQAISLFETSLADRQCVLGSGHPDTLANRDNLARAYRKARQRDQAGPLLKTLKPVIADSALMPESGHSGTLANQSAERFDRIVSLFETSLADRQRVLGSDHPDTLASSDALADAYESAGRFDQAISLFETSLADRQRVLGSDHPGTLTNRDNLAHAYRKAGRFDQAIPLLRAVVIDNERVLGPDHPASLTAWSNLAYVFMEAGRLDQAIPLLEKAYSDSKRVLMPIHTYTLTIRNNLACALIEVEILDQAIAQFKDILAVCVRIMPSEHPITNTVRTNLDIARSVQGR